MIPTKRYLDSFSSAGRKKVPMYSGLMAYFPDACAAVAEHSYKGNEKHNPGEPLHHARGKSMDHTDCIVRHVAAGPEGMDGDSLDAVALAWRAMAYCQEVLERKYALTLPENVVDPRAFRETNSLVGPNGEQAPMEIASNPLAIPRGVTPAMITGFKAPHDKTEEHDFEVAARAAAAPIKGPNKRGLNEHIHGFVPETPSVRAWPDFDEECIPGN